LRFGDFVLSNFFLIYRLDELKKSSFEYFEKVEMKNCWVNGPNKTIHLKAIKDGHEFDAWGSSNNEVIAIAVALMELIERVHIYEKPDYWKNLRTGERINHNKMVGLYPVLNQFMRTSSGLSSQLNEKKCIQGSIKEIIERHVITKSLLCDLGFSMHSKDTFFAHGPLGYIVAVKRYKIQNKGYIFGSGAGLSLNEAIHCAEKELSGQIVWSQNTENVNYFLNQNNINGPSLVQSSNLKDFSDFKISTNVSIDKELSLNDFWFGKIKIISSFNNIPSLKITRAFSPKIQPLFFEPLLGGPLNPAALSGYSVKPSRKFNVVA
jgi:hypothetical protein